MKIITKLMVLTLVLFVGVAKTYAKESKPPLPEHPKPGFPTTRK